MPGPVLEYLSEGAAGGRAFRDGTDLDIMGLFADARLWHAGTRNADVRLTRFDPGAGRTILRWADNDDLLADLQTPGDVLITSDLGRYRVYEWRRRASDTAPSGSTDVIFRLVTVKSAEDAASLPVLPAGAVLRDGLVHRRVGSLLRVAVKQPGVDCCTGGGYGDGAVRLDASWNTILSRGGAAIVARRYARETVEAGLSMEAGSGPGRFPSCPENSGEVKSIGRALPDANGEFDLAGSDCIHVRRPDPVSHSAATRLFTDRTAVIPAAALVIGSDCKACCDCSDIGSAYEALLRLWNQAKALGERVQASYARYVVLRDALLAKQAACAGLNVSCSLAPRPDYHLGLGIFCVNNNREASGPILLTMEVTPDGHTFTAGSGLLDSSGARMLAVTPTITGGVMTVVLPSLAPGRFASYSCELRWYAGTARAGAVARLVATADSTVGSGSCSKALPLHGPLEKT